MDKSFAYIDEFVEKLSQEKDLPLVTNQYSYEIIDNQIRRENLKSYLRSIYQNNSNTILVGEAAGYNGCLLSGIPFTSERLIRQTIPNLAIFRNPYTLKSNGEQYELSATIVWNAFQEFDFYPLLWNTFPFHPYKSGIEISNRKPTMDEVERGQIYIKELVAMLKIKRIVAVGKVAERVLVGLYGQNNVLTLRHPANGGANLFRSGLENLARTKVS